MSDCIIHSFVVLQRKTRSIILIYLYHRFDPSQPTYQGKSITLRPPHLLVHYSSCEAPLSHSSIHPPLFITLRPPHLLVHYSSCEAPFSHSSIYPLLLIIFRSTLSLINSFKLTPPLISSFFTQSNLITRHIFLMYLNFIA